MLKKTQSGFTLIELLVVIAVIAVLAAATFGLINVNTQFARARDAKRIQDLKIIQQALQAYYNDNGFFPPTCVNSPAGGNWFPAIAPYLKNNVPIPPNNKGTGAPWDAGDNQTYGYCPWCPSNGVNSSSYLLSAKLESPSAVSNGVETGCGTYGPSLNSKVYIVTAP